MNEIIIIPFNPENLKDASYTFTLGSSVRVLKKKDFIDSRNNNLEFDELEISENGYELKPGDFAVFRTGEKISLKGKYICMLSTRSMIAQMGVDVAQSSFFAEPDTDNQFTLEVANHSTMPVRLYSGMKIIKGIFSSVI